jgi:hypothetical protein
MRVRLLILVIVVLLAGLMGGWKWGDRYLSVTHAAAPTAAIA